MYSMTEHIREAIDLNKSRMPLYAKLTDKKSLKYSRRLIIIEYCCLFVAKIIDHRAAFFHKHKVKIISTDFISMTKTPVFKSSFAKHINYKKEFVELSLNETRQSLQTLIQKSDFGGIDTLCAQFLFQISKSPHHYGMIRHLFESIRRIAYLAPLHDAECQKRSIKSSIPLSKILLRLHLIILHQAYLFDKEIAFIQNKGVPFIIQDMPRIELENPYKYSTTSLI